MTKGLTIIVVLAIIIAAIVVFTKDGTGNEEQMVRSVVTEFGDRLKNVPLTAPRAEAAATIEEEYAEFVTPELLVEWMNDPSQAPGRLTSSPWPERIEITSLEKSGEEYRVRGNIVLMTSVEEVSGGNAGTEEVEIMLRKEGLTWLISSFERVDESSDDEGLEIFTHTDPNLSLSYPGDLFREENESPAGRGATFWSELSEEPGETFLTLTLLDSVAPETNLSEARLTVGATDNSAAVAECTSVEPSTPTEREEVTVNGVPFTLVRTSEAAAGNLYDVVSYRTLQGERCIALEYLIHSTNIENYPEGTIDEFDRAEIEAHLESVIQSLILEEDVVEEEEPA